MCQYCSNNFESHTHDKLNEKHYIDIQKVPFRIKNMVANNEQVGTELLENLDALIQKYNLTPDANISFLYKEKIKQNLEMLIQPIKNNQDRPWKKNIVNYFY